MSFVTLGLGAGADVQRLLLLGFAIGEAHQDEQYPLAGQSQTYALFGQAQQYPLAGQAQHYPLG